MPSGTPSTHSDIFVMNADGSGVRQLTHNGWPLSGLAWSPDGRALAFSADTGGCEAIMVMGVDGLGTSRLTACGATRNPSWSPDGSRIAFENDFTIYTMKADGTGLAPLSGAGAGVNPV